MYLSEWQWISENGFAISLWAPRPKFNFTSARDLFTSVSLFRLSSGATHNHLFDSTISRVERNHDVRQSTSTDTYYTLCRLCKRRTWFRKNEYYRDTCIWWFLQSIRKPDNASQTLCHRSYFKTPFEVQFRAFVRLHIKFHYCMTKHISNSYKIQKWLKLVC